MNIFSGIEKKDNANKFLQIEGWTLLLLAASSVQSKVISLLLTYGADPNKDKGMDQSFIIISSCKLVIITKL